MLAPDSAQRISRGPRQWVSQVSHLLPPSQPTGKMCKTHPPSSLRCPGRLCYCPLGMLSSLGPRASSLQIYVFSFLKLAFSKGRQPPTPLPTPRLSAPPCHVA